MNKIICVLNVNMDVQNAINIIAIHIVATIVVNVLVPTLIAQLA